MRWPERRWWVCGMLFAATTIAYIDRQTFPFVASTVPKEYGLSNEQVARILSAFLMSYTLGQPLAGLFFDRVGSRIGFAVSIGVWSLANMLTATVTGFRGFVGLSTGAGPRGVGQLPRRGQGRRRAVSPRGAIVRRRRLHERRERRRHPGGPPGHRTSPTTGGGGPPSS